MSTSDPTKYEKSLKINEIFIVTLAFLLFIADVVLVSLLLFKYILVTNPEQATFQSLFALLVSVNVMVYPTIFSLKNDLEKTKARIRADIRASIDLFYVPLLNLITIDEENVTYKDRVRMINEIRGHKHLVETVEPGLPSLLPILDKYLKTKAESKVVSGELLKLVNRDLARLHKRYDKLREINIRTEN